MANLWAIAYDDLASAKRLCAELVQLDAEQILQVEDLNVILCHADGSFEFRREFYPPSTALASGGALGFLIACLIQPLMPPGMGMLAALLGPAVGAFVGNLSGSLVEIGVDRSFVRDVQAIMKPGTVTVFAMGSALDEGRLRPRLQGIGGTVLHTDVVVERARQIQTLLKAEGR